MLSTGLENTGNRYLCAGYIFLPLQVFGRVRLFANLKHLFYGFCPHGSLGNINSPFGTAIILLNRKAINIYLRSAFEGRGKSSPNVFILSKLFLFSRVSNAFVFLIALEASGSPSRKNSDQQAVNRGA